MTRLVLLSLTLAAGSAAAQGPAAYPNVGATQPVLSPYLNLNRNNAAVNYYNFTRPGTVGFAQPGGLQANGFQGPPPSATLFPDSPGVTELRTAFITSGHPTAFNNTLGYFNNTNGFNRGFGQTGPQQTQRNNTNQTAANSRGRR